MSSIWDYEMSISDDDLCSTCKHLEYNPGGLSACKLAADRRGGPCEFNEDQYAVDCVCWEPLPKETTPRSDVQLFSNSICPHCGGKIKITLERREDGD